MNILAVFENAINMDKDSIIHVVTEQVSPKVGGEVEYSL